MSKMKNNLHLVTALTLGATMLSPVDRVWGMMTSLEEQGSASCSRSQSRSATVPGLVGDVLVTDDLRLGAGAILATLDSGADPKKIKSQPDFLAHLLKLKNYGVEGVMAYIKRNNPSNDIKTDDCIKQTLLMIRDAQPDPYFDLLKNRILITSSDSTVEQRIKSIKNRADVESLFGDEFPHLHKDLINSFLARLPEREQGQFEQIYAKAFESYFDLTVSTLQPIKRRKKEKLGEWMKREAQHKAKQQEQQRELDAQKTAAQLAYQTKLGEAANMYANLLEFETLAVLEESAGVFPSSNPVPLPLDGMGSSEPVQSLLPLPIDPDLTATDPLVGSSSISIVETMEVEAEKPLPFKFNPTFLGALEDVPAYVDRPVGTPSNYQFVVDPAQGGRQWGARRVVKKGDGHVAVEGDGYVFYYQIPTAEMKLLHGKQFRFEVDALSHTPGAYIQYWGYRNASSEKIKSFAHSGDGSWQKLSLDFTIDEDDTMHFLYPIILPAISEGSDTPVVEVRNVRVKQL
jgi:hypothetical protein